MRRGQSFGEIIWDLVVAVLVVSGFLFWAFIGYCIVHGRPW